MKYIGCKCKMISSVGKRDTEILLASAFAIISPVLEIVCPQYTNEALTERRYSLIEGKILLAIAPAERRAAELRS